MEQVNTGSIKNAVVTACNSKYFKSCLTLITSLRKHSEKDIDIICFWFWVDWSRTTCIVEFGKSRIYTNDRNITIYTIHKMKISWFLTPNQFGWKAWFIRFVFESSDVQNVVWIDSGIVTFGNIKFIFEHIKKHGYWLTEEQGFINHNFTHAVCKEIIQATNEELEGNQLLAGLSGFNKDKGFDIVH